MDEIKEIANTALEELRKTLASLEEQSEELRIKVWKTRGYIRVKENILKLGDEFEEIEKGPPPPTSSPPPPPPPPPSSSPSIRTRPIKRRGTFASSSSASTKKHHRGKGVVFVCFDDGTERLFDTQKSAGDVAGVDQTIVSKSVRTGSNVEKNGKRYRFFARRRVGVRVGSREERIYDDQIAASRATKLTAVQVQSGCLDVAGVGQHFFEGESVEFRFVNSDEEDESDDDDEESD